MLATEQTQLRQRIAQHFSAEELRTLCHDLGLDYDDLGGRGKADNARELVELIRRTHGMDALTAALKAVRPKVNWEADAAGTTDFPRHNLPFPRNPNFTGREELLAQLAQNLPPLLRRPSHRRFSGWAAWARHSWRTRNGWRERTNVTCCCLTMPIR